MELKNYSVEEVIYEGTETRVCRAVHSPSGARVVLKLPVGEVPSPRVLGRLVHEHQVLVQLAAVSNVARARKLVQQGCLDLSLEHLLIDALMAQTTICGAAGSQPMLTVVGVARPVSEARRWKMLTPMGPFFISTFSNLYQRSRECIDRLRAGTKLECVPPSALPLRHWRNA